MINSYSKAPTAPSVKIVTQVLDVFYDNIKTCLELNFIEEWYNFAVRTLFYLFKHKYFLSLTAYRGGDEFCCVTNITGRTQAKQKFPLVKFLTRIIGRTFLMSQTYSAKITGYNYLALHYHNICSESLQNRFYLWKIRISLNIVALK